jgi:hypothetical protein
MRQLFSVACNATIYDGWICSICELPMLFLIGIVEDTRETLHIFSARKVELFEGEPDAACLHRFFLERETVAK